ncbi:NitT/TauT family transport system substrate-binding protein [Micromonospora pisi]|uniref:NitT/TauT family transport system substrate-binding protein n=1 Tax=Micromonospora pisi TaxID=589240 RepID=A0A495JMR4_9ACTN|nr:ABC transporter substrate-binding protein [Micromonospora pisi]RKR90121.1 NitT/TauT family transport system substrate-binding protein [Micromonospora pisi]
MRKTGRSRILAAALLAATTLVAAGCTGSPEPQAGDPNSAPDRVTYLTGFGTGGHDAFAWVAREKGFFASAGLDVTVQLGAPATNNQALASGRAQFTYSDVTQLMIQAGTGTFTDLRVITAVHQDTLVAIFAPEDSGITAATDLTGKRVGAATGSITQTLLPAYGKLAGFDAGSLDVVNSQPPQLAGLLAGNQVDVLSTFIITRGTVETVTGKKMVVFPFRDHLPDLLGTGLTTTAGLAEEKPEMVRRFRDAALRGLAYTLDHPEEAAEIMKKHNPAVNVRGAATEITLMTPYVRPAAGATIGVIDRQRAARSIGVLEQAGLIPGGLSPDSVVDFDLVPKP